MGCHEQVYTGRDDVKACYLTIVLYIHLAQVMNRGSHEVESMSMPVHVDPE